MHAPLFHPALKNVAQVRKELGVKTFFNMLGPLVNPARPQYRLVGVYHLELARIYYYILQREESRFHVIHSFDGYDEISLTGDFKSFSNAGEKQYAPSDLKLEKLAAESIAGGTTVEESAEIFRKILMGKGTTEQNSVVIANAAFAIQAAQNKSLNETVEAARESLLSGKAYEIFKKLTA
jgi:anthranilate phosphoribosyltransferase